MSDKVDKFALDTPAIGSFRDLAKQATVPSTDDIVSKFRQWKEQNPALAWGVSQLPLAAHALGPNAGLAADVAGIAGVGSPPVRQPTSFERDQRPTPEAPSEPGVPVAKLPDAPPIPTPPKMSAGMGPGGDVYEGYGTDKGVLHSQLNTTADMGNLQEKKWEEYGHKLAGMNTAADLMGEHAEQQRRGAKAYSDSVAQSEKEQLDAETKAQQASDETAAMGTDPGRYLRNRDAGFWINMMLGSVASGLLSAMQGRGGENPFMDSVRQTVKQDIDSQEQAIAQGWKKVKGLETAYERARLRGADRVTATQKQYDMVLQALETDAKGRLMKAQIPEEKARLEGLLQSLQIERDQENTKLQEYWRQIRESRARAAAAAANAQRTAERQSRLDAQEWEFKKSQIAKNYAEADKTKAGEQDKELEKDKRAYGVHSQYLTSDEVTGLAKGAPGSTSSKLGVARAPWQTDARAYKQSLDQYNAEVNTVLGHWMKIEAGRVPVGEFNNIVHRYELNEDMTDAEKMSRIKGLKAWVDERAKTSGVLGSQPAGRPTDLKTIPSFQPKKE